MPEVTSRSPERRSSESHHDGGGGRSGNTGPSERQDAAGRRLRRLLLRRERDRKRSKGRLKVTRLLPLKTLTLGIIMPADWSVPEETQADSQLKPHREKPDWRFWFKLGGTRTRLEVLAVPQDGVGFSGSDRTPLDFVSGQIICLDSIRTPSMPCCSRGASLCDGSDRHKGTVPEGPAVSGKRLSEPPAVFTSQRKGGSSLHQELLCSAFWARRADQHLEPQEENWTQTPTATSAETTNCGSVGTF